MSESFDKEKSKEATSGILNGIGAIDNELRKLRKEMAKIREERAKRSVTVNATRVVKKKETLEQQLENGQGPSSSIETNFAGEVSEASRITVQAFQDGIKQTKHVSVFEIHHNVQDQLEDMLCETKKMVEAFGRTYNTPEIDDYELEAEFEALGEEIALDDDTSYLDDVKKSPEATSNKLETQDIITNEIDEL